MDRYQYILPLKGGYNIIILILFCIRWIARKKEVDCWRCFECGLSVLSGQFKPINDKYLQRVDSKELSSPTLLL